MAELTIKEVEDKFKEVSKQNLDRYASKNPDHTEFSEVITIGSDRYEFFWRRHLNVSTKDWYFVEVIER